MHDDEASAFWRSYVEAGGSDGEWTAWGFAGDDQPGMRTELGLLVRDGPKRATAGMYEDFGPEGEPFPRVGEHSVIIDGDGRPVCIILTTDVEVRSFGEVDERFAWDEGEGDRTLAWWRQAHRRYFEEAGRAIGEETPMVLERFDLVWPTR